LSYTPRPSRAGINMAMLPSLLESYKAIPSLPPPSEKVSSGWELTGPSEEVVHEALRPVVHSTPF